MPIYQCAAPAGMLTGSMKAQIATAITDAHVEMTGAPRVFVHVFFSELPRASRTAPANLTPKSRA